MDTNALSPVAGFVLRAVQSHPDLPWLDAVARHADADDAYEEQHLHEGASELHANGLLEEHPERGWKLTEAGEAA
jgi:hypothetical protein